MKTMKLAWYGVAFVIAATAVPVHAIMTIDSSIGGGALSGMTYLDFDDGLPALVTLNSGNPNGDAKWISGGEANEYAPPYLAGNNNNNFGSLYTGPDTTYYLTSGNSTEPGGSIEFTFEGAQNYFGLLWGSVDNYNTLTFLMGDTEVGSVTGSQALLLGNGYQGIGGSTYVNITGISFDKVRVTSDQYAFELDNVAYGKVPDAGMTVALLGISLGALALARRRFAF
jgi:hypothetical protein